MEELNAIMPGILEELNTLMADIHEVEKVKADNLCSDSNDGDPYVP